MEGTWKFGNARNRGFSLDRDLSIDGFQINCEGRREDEIDMCISFVYINNSPGPDCYRLIVVNNRDESYSRPTHPVHYWTHQPWCLGGVDGVAGGTWLAVSQRGKVGMLFNVLTREDKQRHKPGRGQLVVEYLTQRGSAMEYLEKLSTKASELKLFNLVLLEKSGSGRWQLYYMTNASQHVTNMVTIPPEGIHVFSNSFPGKPFQKEIRGKKRFAKIIEMFGEKGMERELEEKLVELMRDTTCQLPDPAFSQQGAHLDHLLQSQWSALYIHSPQIAFGTRTITVLTERQDGFSSYTEYTMSEPIQADDPQWIKTTKHFYTLKNVRP